MKQNLVGEYTFFVKKENAVFYQKTLLVLSINIIKKLFTKDYLEIISMSHSSVHRNTINPKVSLH